MPRPLRSGRKPTTDDTHHATMTGQPPNVRVTLPVRVKTQLHTVVPPSSHSTLPKEQTPPFERQSSSSNTATTPQATGAGTATTTPTSPQKPKPNAPSTADSAPEPTFPRPSSRKGFAGPSKPSQAASHVSNVVRTPRNRTFLLIRYERIPPSLGAGGSQDESAALSRTPCLRGELRIGP
jgi:hypothetical protein